MPPDGFVPRVSRSARLRKEAVPQPDIEAPEPQENLPNQVWVLLPNRDCRTEPDSWEKLSPHLNHSAADKASTEAKAFWKEAPAFKCGENFVALNLGCIRVLASPTVSLVSNSRSEGINLHQYSQRASSDPSAAQSFVDAVLSDNGREPFLVKVVQHDLQYAMEYWLASLRAAEVVLDVQPPVTASHIRTLRSCKECLEEVEKALSLLKHLKSDEQLTVLGLLAAQGCTDPNAPQDEIKSNLREALEGCEREFERECPGLRDNIGNKILRADLQVDNLTIEWNYRRVTLVFAACGFSVLPALLGSGILGVNSVNGLADNMKAFTPILYTFLASWPTISIICCLVLWMMRLL